MKGLLLKDFYQTIKYCKLNFLIDAVFIVVSFFSEELTFYLFFPIMISGILPITLLSHDERCGWTSYSGTLPYSRAQIVSAKYLFGLLVEAFTAVIVLAGLIVRNGIYGETDIAGSFTAVGAMIAVSLAVPAFCLPFCFKLGTEKGRHAYFIIAGLITVAIVLLPKGFAAESEIITNIGKAAFVPAVAVVAIYAASWVVSVAVYRKTEIIG